MNIKEKFNNLDKRSLLPLGIIVLIAVIVAVGLFYFLSKDEQIDVQKQVENERIKILKSLTGEKTKSTEKNSESENITETLSGSSEIKYEKTNPDNENILNNLTGTK